jgi:hypothetical protein
MVMSNTPNVNLVNIDHKSTLMRSQTLLQTQMWVWSENNEKVEAHSLVHSIWGGGVEGRAGAPGWGLRRVASINYSHGHAQTKQQVDWCIVWALLVLGWATGNSDSQDSPRPGLGGSHHLPFYSILCASSQGPHPNDILSHDSQIGVLKFPKLGLPWLWGPITLCADLRLRWDLEQSYSFRWDLSNGMWHATCTQESRVDSRLLVVGSQIVNLTPDLSFGHNLCFKCPNESCEPILDIYISIAFQWYKELFNPLGFDPCNCPLKIRESTGTPNSELQTRKVEALLGVWGFIPSHFLSLLGFFLARNLASPCFGREPKARVATNMVVVLMVCSHNT